MEIQTGFVGTSFGNNLAALRHAQKPARGTAAYSRHINRPLARRVAALVHTIGMTPNQATAISATLSATALALLVLLPPTPLLGLGVATFLAAGYVMDSVDGQLARLRGSGSLSGEMLDHTVDCVKTVCLHLAVLISMFRFGALDTPALLWIPIGFLVIDIMSFFGLVTMPLLRRLHDRSGNAASPATASTPLSPEHPLRRYVLLPTDYGVFCWMFVLLGWPLLFLGAYALMFAINAFAVALAMRKWWRELRAMDRTA